VGTSYLQLESGVVVAQTGAGYPAVQAALKRHDNGLELGQVAGCWKVYFRYGSEPHQVSFLCDWRDPDGTPRELSMGLVEKVQALDRNTINSPPTEDELERKRQEALRKHRDEQAEQLADDYKRKTISTSLPRTKNRGNHRWKESEFQKQKRRRERGYDY